MHMVTGSGDNDYEPHRGTGGSHDCAPVLPEHARTDALTHTHTQTRNMHRVPLRSRALPMRL
eukprot:4633588-Amphidinium_carterae.1